MGGSKPCDASRILEPGFGEGYAYLKRSSTLLNEEFSGAKIQYELHRVQQLVSCSHSAFCPLSVEHELRVFLQKLVGDRQGMKLPIFYETNRFITVVKTAH
jgi:ribosomal protein RSM22 (predicted rRNA methylase)